PRTAGSGPLPEWRCATAEEHPLEATSQLSSTSSLIVRVFRVPNPARFRLIHPAAVSTTHARAVNRREAERPGSPVSGVGALLWLPAQPCQDGAQQLTVPSQRRLDALQAGAVFALCGVDLSHVAP